MSKIVMPNVWRFLCMWKSPNVKTSLHKTTYWCNLISDKVQCQYIQSINYLYILDDAHQSHYYVHIRKNYAISIIRKDQVHDCGISYVQPSRVFYDFVVYYLVNFTIGKSIFKTDIHVLISFRNDFTVLCLIHTWFITDEFGIDVTEVGPGKVEKEFSWLREDMVMH